MWDTVGITDRQAQIYEALVRQGRTDPGTIASQLRVSRTQVTRALTDLVSKGMVTRLPGHPPQFAAVSPDQAAGVLIAEQEQGLARLRGHARDLTVTYRKAHTSWRHPAELIDVIEGEANIAGVFTRLLQQAEYQIRGFDRPPYLVSPVAGHPETDEQRYQQGIKYRVVYDHEALAVPGRIANVWSGIHNGEQARVGEVPIKMVLCDERAALIPVTTSTTATSASYLIHPSSLLDAIIALFESTWQRSVPLNRSRAGADPDAPSEDDVNLLGLLAGGSTDEAIARALGWSVRTVRRHVHSLMSHLGAQTRFQLGMEAVRRQWV